MCNADLRTELIKETFVELNEELSTTLAIKTKIYDLIK